MARRKTVRWSPDMIKAGSSEGTASAKRPPTADGRPRRGRGKGAGRTVSDVAVDAHVGARIKLRRSLLGMSQVKLGQAIGLTFQQVQKYERGANRIGASRLYELSQVLDVPVAYFYEEMNGAGKPPPRADGAGEEVEETERDPMTRRETLELIRAYNRITDSGVRRRIFELVKATAKYLDE